MTPYSLFVPDETAAAFRTSMITKEPNFSFVFHTKKRVSLELNEFGEYPGEDVIRDRKAARANYLLWIREACWTLDVTPPSWLKGKTLEKLATLDHLAREVLVSLPRKERHLRQLASSLRGDHRGLYPPMVWLKLVQAGDLLGIYRNQYLGIRDLFAFDSYSAPLANCLREVTLRTNLLEEKLEFPRELYAK